MENKLKNKKYFCNSDVFLREDALSFYLLGCFCTDGCISYQEESNSWRISFVSKDFEWVSEIAKIICSNLPVKLSKKNNCYFIQFTDEKIKNWLIDHGCTPRKSLTLEIKNIPDEYFFEFLKSVIEGDGSIIIKTKEGNKKIQCTINIFSGSEKFLIQIKNKLKNENIESKIYTRAPKTYIINGKTCKTNNLYTLAINKKYIIKLIELLYNNKNCPSLERKKDNAMKILSKCKEEELEKEQKNENFKKLSDKSYDDIMNELKFKKETIWYKCRKINKFPGREDFGSMIWSDYEKLIESIKIIGHKETMKKLGIKNNKTIPRRLKAIGLTIDKIIRPNKKPYIKKEQISCR